MRTDTANLPLSPLSTAQRPFSQRRLWELMNAPRPVDPRAVRIALSILLLVYVVAAAVRYDRHYEFFPALRSIVVLYAVVGIVAARHLDWRRTRIFQIGLTLLLSMSTAYMEARRGLAMSDLALSALTTFVPIAFLLAAADVVVMSGLLLLGHTIVLAFVPATAVTMSVAALVLSSAVATGAATAVVLATYRAGMMQSREWWREACARERALRECAEIAATQVDTAALLDQFAARLLSAFGSGRCLILLAEADGAYRVAASAGIQGGAPTADSAVRFAAASGEVMDELSRRQPIVRALPDAVMRRQFAAGLPADFLGTQLVVLPLVIDGAVGGVVLLSGAETRDFDPDVLALWQAMAQQVGLALGKARLLARLQKAHDARSVFINTMSHELRSPLNIISGYAEMLMEGEGSPAEMGGRIRASTLELLLLVENTMAAARLGAGKVKLQLEDFSLDALFSELADAVARLPEARAATPIHWIIEGQLPAVRLDRLKVKEIIQNLVSNALKYAPGGPITVSAQRTAQGMRLEVRDCGPGVPGEAQGRIFEMFERVERIDGSFPASAGLGLYIVKGLVSLMAGSIAVVSPPGGGATFIVDLPLSFDSSVETAPRAVALSA